ncbi:MAG: hypothetical protein ACP5IZ_10640, partial [Thermoprotei archaeon]
MRDNYYQDRSRFLAIILLLSLLLGSFPATKAYQANADQTTFTFFGSTYTNPFSTKVSFTSGRITLNTTSTPLKYYGDRYVWGTLFNDHPYSANVYAPITPPILFFGTGSAFGTNIGINSWNTVVGGITTKNATTISIGFPFSTSGRIYNTNSTTFQYKSNTYFQIGFITNATLSGAAYAQITDGIIGLGTTAPASYGIYGPTNATQFFVSNIITFDIKTTEGTSVSNMASIEISTPYTYTTQGQPSQSTTFITQKTTLNTIFDTWDKEAIITAHVYAQGYTFVEWKTTGAITIDNPYNPIAKVKIMGDGTITLIITKTTGTVTIYTYDNKTKQGVSGVVIDLYNSQGTIPITTATTNAQGYAYLSITKNIYKLITRTPETSDKYPVYGLNATWRYRFDHYDPNPYLYDPFWGPKYNSPAGYYNNSLIMLNATNPPTTITIAMIKQYRITITSTLTQSTEYFIESPTLTVGETYPSGTVWIDEGKQLPIQAIPKTGYEFYKWIAILEKNRTTNQLPTIQNPTAPKTTITITNPIQLIALFRPATRIVPVY